MSMKKKLFLQLADGEMFTALGERYIKISPLSYRSVDNPTLGEIPYGPLLDKQIGVEPKSTINTKVVVSPDPETAETVAAVKQATKPKKAAKKSTKKRK